MAINCERVNDYIYDPNFYVSSQKDYYRTVSSAQAKSTQYAICSNFDSMFSDLPKYPRLHFVPLPGSDRVPNFIDRSWKAYSASKNTRCQHNIDVIGKDRLIFFKRPISISNLELVFDEEKTIRPEFDIKKKKNKCLQTIYRESSAQTNPWEPPYINLKTGSEPEILKLGCFCWGKGLPPGKHEVNIIERIRKRRAWEKKVPEGGDETSITRRRDIVSQLENEEWSFKDKEIEDINNWRIDLLKGILDDKLTNLSETRLEHMKNLWMRKNFENQQKLVKIYQNKNRGLDPITLRKLKIKYSKKTKPFSSGVTDELINYDSEHYAPLLHQGFRAKHDHITFEKSLNYKMCLKGIEYITTLPNLTNRIDIKDNEMLKKDLPNLCPRWSKWTKSNLDQLYKEFKLPETFKKKSVDNQKSISSNDFEKEENEIKLEDQMLKNLINLTL